MAPSDHTCLPGVVDEVAGYLEGPAGGLGNLGVGLLRGGARRGARRGERSGEEEEEDLSRRDGG